ncbi:MAG TPA: phosphate ABC transporter substrate-binding protein [Planctomycetota bacterium]|nr:phosphate ABC transporter substrate-binding protein [Planctomycetota bacterium]
MLKSTLFASLCLALGAAFTACGKSNRTVLQNKGSDTMLEVAQVWAEKFHEARPDIGVSVTGGGSSVGVAGIINGTVDIANCSRAMTDQEIADARSRKHDPVQHQVGFDGIAIFVHKDNPIASITIEQLKQIYVDGGTITQWSQLGVKMPEGRDKIVVISRQANSGTYEYFKESVLGGHKANFRLGTLDMNGSKDVVDQVVKTQQAIGYSGLAYGKGVDVKMLPVSAKEGQPAVAPSIDTVLDKTYPISRPLFMYTSGPPTGATKEYLEWITGDDGQRILFDLGYPPLRKI